MTILYILGGLCLLCWLAETVILGIMFIRHCKNDNYPEDTE